MNENISCSKIDKLSKNFSGFQEAHDFTPKFLASLAFAIIPSLSKDLVEKKENDTYSTENGTQSKRTLTPNHQKAFDFEKKGKNSRNRGKGSLDSRFKSKKVSFSSENTYVFF
jgi:hypothetical protein